MASIVFVNGSYEPTLSEMGALPAGAIWHTSGEWNLTIPDNCQLTQPIKLIYKTDGVDIVNAKHTIKLGKNSKLLLVDEFDGNPEHTMYAFNKHIEQKQNSLLSLVCLKKGAKASRDNIHVLLAEPGAECKTAGFYHVNQPQQSVEYHLTIEHAAAHTTSDMLFKGIAENKSRAVFVGKLHVHEGAQKINAQQANHNLLLTNDAEISSKPELEIYADDVKCKHGATTGQLDHEALFYLRARGIPEQEAKQMLVQGFADEVLQRLTIV